MTIDLYQGKPPMRGERLQSSRNRSDRALCKWKTVKNLSRSIAEDELQVIHRFLHGFIVLGVFIAARFNGSHFVLE